MNLVIVESPAKAKTIEKYLGSDFRVLATFGHVRDLPSKKLGVDVAKNFQPEYSVLPKAKKIVDGEIPIVTENDQLQSDYYTITLRKRIKKTLKKEYTIDEKILTKEQLFAMINEWIDKI